MGMALNAYNKLTEDEKEIKKLFELTAWTEWSQCDSVCSRGIQTRFAIDPITGERQDKKEIQTCHPDDLQCAIDVSVPVIIILFCCLILYKCCKCSISDLKRGKAKMRNYRSVLSIGRRSSDDSDQEKKRPILR